MSLPQPVPRVQVPATLAPIPGGPGIRIGERLGTGGLGTTWHAWLDDGTPVVLKRVTPSQRELPALLERMREAHAVHHANLVALIDVAADEHSVWAVARAEPAVPLSLLLERGRVRPAQGVAIGMAVLAGLAALHQAGLHHGAVHAGNVLVDREGQVRLADFGMAPPASGTGAATNPFAQDVRAVGSLLGQMIDAAPGTALGAAIRSIAGSRRKVPRGYEAVHASLTLWEAAGRLAATKRQSEAREQLADAVADAMGLTLPRSRPRDRAGRPAAGRPEVEAETPAGIDREVEPKAQTVGSGPPPAPEMEEHLEPTGGSDGIELLRPAIRDQLPQLVAAVKAIRGAAYAYPGTRAVAASAASEALQATPRPAARRPPPRVWPVWLAATALLVAALTGTAGAVAQRFDSGHGPVAGRPAVPGIAAGATNPATPLPARPGEAKSPPPASTLPPAAAGAVTGVGVTTAGSCRPGGYCLIIASATLAPAASARSVTWSVSAYDVCTGRSTPLATLHATVRAGRVTASVAGGVILPRGALQQVVAVTAVPAVASSAAAWPGVRPVTVACP